MKRRRAAKELLLILWPMAALLIAAAIAIVVAVRHTVRPLERSQRAGTPDGRGAEQPDRQRDPLHPGRRAVRIEVFDRPASIRVADSGPGIPPEERLLVLERFVRGRAATGEGSGLGLAIASDIARLRGAVLTLDGNEWGGLTATIVFDTATASRAGAAPRARFEPTGDTAA